MSTKSQPQTGKEKTQKQQVKQPDAQSLDTQIAQVNSTVALQRARLDPRSLTPGNVLQLQRTIGNQAVDRLLVRTTQRQVVQRVLNLAGLGADPQKLTVNLAGQVQFEFTPANGNTVADLKTALRTHHAPSAQKSLIVRRYIGNDWSPLLNDADPLVAGGHYAVAWTPDPSQDPSLPYDAPDGGDNDSDTGSVIIHNDINQPQLPPGFAH